MAYTEIHPIKVTLGKAIDYICNKEKTENGFGFLLIIVNIVQRNTSLVLQENQ